MRRVAHLVPAIASLLVVGCAVENDRLRVRDGLLMVGMRREAFEQEWGLPERTQPISSEEFTRLSVSWGSSGGGGGFFKGKSTLDMWSYEKRDVILVFDGVRLVSWKTEKSRQELAAPQSSVQRSTK